jgi:hypothetical protein
MRAALPRRATDSEGSTVTETRQHDEYLLEVYRQAGENARMYAQSRFSNLSGFLTYVGLLTAAVAFLFGNQDDHAVFEHAVPLVSLLGCVLSVLFWALEVRHHHWWEFYELQVVRSLEDVMGRGQYPPEAQAGQRRAFINGRRLFGLSATAATYGIYLSSLVFFLVVGLISLFD